MRRAWILLACALPALALATPGSWSADVSNVDVGGPGRSYVSNLLVPPPASADAHIRRVQWSYRLPPGRRIDAQLCTPRRCIALAGPRGASEALAGAPANAHLHFTFRLPAGTATPVQVSAIQLLVDDD